MFEINSSNFKYTALFCEENIWHLADSLIRQGISSNELDVVFVSNPKQQVAMFNQQSSQPNQPVVWDYHVILLRTSASITNIYDFDTRVSFVSTATQYFDLSFPDNIKPAYKAMFRIIPSTLFLERFSSDRSHMLGIIEPNHFPDYPSIQSDNALYLKDLIDFNQPILSNEHIFSLSEIKQRLFKDK